MSFLIEYWRRRIERSSIRLRILGRFLTHNKKNVRVRKCHHPVRVVTGSAYSCTGISERWVPPRQFWSGAWAYKTKTNSFVRYDPMIQYISMILLTSRIIVRRTVVWRDSYINRVLVLLTRLLVLGYKPIIVVGGLNCPS